MRSNDRVEGAGHWSVGRRLTIYLLAAFLPALALLLLLEGGARWYLHANYAVPGKSYGLWRYDELLGAQHAENAYNTSYQTNDFGFRNSEPVKRPKPTGALRIIAYGGSTTFCYNLGLADTWPAQLEDLLRKRRNPDDQVLNAGAIAWSLGHAFARARTDFPALEPDLVIIYSGINEDLNARSLAADGLSMKDLAGAGGYGRFATNLEQNSWLRRNLVTVKLLDKMLGPWVRATRDTMAPPIADRDAPSAPDPWILKNYLTTLEGFLDFALAHGAQPLFVVQTHGRNNRMNRYLTSYSRAGADVARRRGARLIDAEEFVLAHEGEAMDLFTGSGVHYAPLGARRLAEIVFREVLAAADLPPASPRSEAEPTP